MEKTYAKYRSAQVSERLGRVGEERRVGSQGCVNVGEDLLEGGGGPAEGMGDLVPLVDELEDGALECGQIGEVGRAEALASEDAEPVLSEPMLLHVL